MRVHLGVPFLSAIPFFVLCTMSIDHRVSELRQTGMGYGSIAKALGVSKSLVRYYVNPAERERSKSATTEARKNNPLRFKLYRMLTRKLGNYVRGSGDRTLAKLNYPEIVAKFTDNPRCYMTGTTIDLMQPSTYHLDHIVPVSRGGSSTLDNLGLAIRVVNQSKADMTPDEYISLCKQVLEFHGFTIISPS